MRTNSAPSGDFNREDQPATVDRLVQMATTYSHMATPEETDAMLDAAYGPGRHPGYEGRRWDRKPRLCEQCGKPITGRGRRFCSHKCWGEWQRPVRPEPVEVDEAFQKEAQAALRELRLYIEERKEQEE